MHTINQKVTFTAPVAAVDAVEILRLKVVRQNKVSIHAYTEQSGLTVIVQYVLTDPITGVETYANYQTYAMVASQLEAINYNWKIDHLRVVYHTSGTGSGSKTLQVTGTTSE